MSKASSEIANILVGERYSRVFRKNLRAARYIIDHSERVSRRVRGGRLLFMREKTFLALLGFIEKNYSHRKSTPRMVSVIVRMWYAGDNFAKIQKEMGSLSHMAIARMLKRFAKAAGYSEVVVEQMKPIIIRRSGLLSMYFSYYGIDPMEFVVKHNFRMI